MGAARRGPHPHGVVLAVAVIPMVAARRRTGSVRGMSTTRQQLRPMKAIPGGTFWMGSACFYPEEGPVHQGTVDSFWMDQRPETVAEYRAFLAPTGYGPL